MPVRKIKILDLTLNSQIVDVNVYKTLNNKFSFNINNFKFHILKNNYTKIEDIIFGFDKLLLSEHLGQDVETPTITEFNEHWNNILSTDNVQIAIVKGGGKESSYFNSLVVINYD